MEHLPDSEARDLEGGDFKKRRMARKVCVVI